MSGLQWGTSDAVWVPELDDDHKEIFAAVDSIQKALLHGSRPAAIRQAAERLGASIEGHFAHEERLMRAALYDSRDWHKQLHNAARTKVRRWSKRMAEGDIGAAREAVEYLGPWLQNHTRVADRMLGSFLRNQRRCAKLTFRAGTKPAEGRSWTRADGERFDPLATSKGF